MDYFVNFTEKYIRSELLVLIPVLYIIAKFMDGSKIDKSKIPLILLGVSVFLSGLYTFSAVKILNWTSVLSAIFGSFVQGILISGSAVFGGIVVQSTCKKGFYTKSKDGKCPIEEVNNSLKKLEEVNDMLKKQEELEKKSKT